MRKFIQIKQLVITFLFMASTFTSTSVFSATEYSATTQYVKGDEVIHDGETYVAKWNHQAGKEPGVAFVWERVVNVVKPVTDWNAVTTYVKGDKVIHNGETYVAKWGQTGKEPEASTAWEIDENDAVFGVIGPAGPQGEQGLQGLSGQNGVDGKDGVAGLQGEQGLQGLPGQNGADGKDGAVGPQGEVGPAGPAGTSANTIPKASIIGHIVIGNVTVDVNSFELGVYNSIEDHAGYIASGRANFTDLTVTINPENSKNSSIVELNKLAFQGYRDLAELYLIDSNEKAQPIFIFGNTSIISLSSNESTITITLRYENITWNDLNGNSAGWDILINQALSSSCSEPALNFSVGADDGPGTLLVKNYSLSMERAIAVPMPQDTQIPKSFVQNALLSAGGFDACLFYRVVNPNMLSSATLAHYSKGIYLRGYILEPALVSSYTVASSPANDGSLVSSFNLWYNKITVIGPDSDTFTYDLSAQ